MVDEAETFICQLNDKQTHFPFRRISEMLGCSFWHHQDHYLLTRAPSLSGCLQPDRSDDESAPQIIQASQPRHYSPQCESLRAVPHHYPRPRPGHTYMPQYRAAVRKAICRRRVGSQPPQMYKQSRITDEREGRRECYLPLRASCSTKLSSLIFPV